MSICRKIEIDGQEVLFKTSAAIPRIEVSEGYL